jgi:hypothetical protein
MSFRNRTLVAGANGVIVLSVPLQNGRDQKRLMKEVRIDNGKKWQAQHWKSIESSYNRSPWFDHYRDELAHLYQSRFEFLMDWNRACFEWTQQRIGLPSDFSFTENYREHYEDDSHIDRRNKILPKNFRDFDPVKYRQVFEERLGFFPNLSILDLLFCEGKRARELLSS